MILVGNKITSVDHLHPIDLDDFVKSIKSPEDQLLSLISQVRIAKSVNEQYYRQLKKQLPYIVCASLNPAIRRTENFVYTEFFVLDIDHVSEMNTNVSQLRDKIQKDSRVLVCFLSPGEDGLKIMFRLSERCTDSGLFSLFYKEFARKFAVKHNIEQAVDSRTSDVCRACFVSYDPEIYYNPNAELVCMNDYLELDNPLQMSDLKHELMVYDTEKLSDSNLPVKIEPSEDDFAQIREILNICRKSKPPVEKNIFVPDELVAAMYGIIDTVNSVGASILDVRDINYGKKIVMSKNNHLAEVNVFYGKRGFTVVQSPKTGTNQELNTLMAELIQLKLAE